VADGALCFWAAPATCGPSRPLWNSFSHFFRPFRSARSDLLNRAGQQGSQAMELRRFVAHYLHADFTRVAAILLVICASSVSRSR
jgi:hypothetical protein